MQLLSKMGRVPVALATTVVSAVMAPVLDGQQLSLSEANAACGGRFNTAFVEKSQLGGYAELMALRRQRDQQREKNQSKIAIGMTQDDVIQLLGRPDNGGAAWLDNADPFCIWTYYRIPEPGGNNTPGYRDIDIHISFSHRVIGIHFQPVMFTSVEGLGIQQK